MMRVVRMILLVVIWLTLWSDWSAANAISGLLLATCIVVVFDTWRDGRIAVRPIHAVRFAGYFVLKLAQSTVTMTRAILDPRDRTRSGIIAVPLGDWPDAIITLIADAISLTPGTLSIEVTRDPPTLFVHAFDVGDADQVHDEVRRLERLAVEAFGDRRSIATLAEDATAGDSTAGTAT